MKFWTHLSAIGSALVLASSCASTANLAAGNPLPGIGLGASGDAILLSWTEGSPLANRLPPRTQVRVLASYDTEYGKVSSEVVGRSNVRAGFPGIKLKLADALQFAPSGPVCLRLAVGRSPIPVRIPHYDQSSDGFYYDEWASIAAVKGEQKFLETQYQTISSNVENFSEPDPNFEAWRIENNLSSVAQCNTLTNVTPGTKPPTALQGQAKVAAAKRQCVALYKRAEVFSDFPAVDALLEATAQNATAYSSAVKMRDDMERYSPGKVYFPGSNLPIVGTLRTMLSVNSDEEGVSEVLAKLVIEAYQACETEAQTRFDESVRSWNEVSNPDTLAQREAPLRKLCQARFAREGDRLNRLAEFRGIKAEIEAELNAMNSSQASALPENKRLIPHACPIEN